MFVNIYTLLRFTVILTSVNWNKFKKTYFFFKNKCSQYTQNKINRL